MAQAISFNNLGSGLLILGRFRTVKIELHLAIPKNGCGIICSIDVTRCDGTLIRLTPGDSER